MPFCLRKVTPVSVCNRPLPDDVDNVLEAMSNQALSGVLRQMASVFLLADSLMESLLSQLQSVATRTEALQTRLETFSAVCLRLDARSVVVPESDLATAYQQQHRPIMSTEVAKVVFSEETRPQALQNLYNSCHLSPAVRLRHIDPFRRDGVRSSRMFRCMPTMADTEPDNLLDIETRVPAEVENMPSWVPTVDILAPIHPDSRLNMVKPMSKAITCRLPTINQLAMARARLSRAETVAIDTSATSFQRLAQLRRSLPQMNYSRMKQKRKSRRMRSKTGHNKTANDESTQNDLETNDCETPTSLESTNGNSASCSKVPRGWKTRGDTDSGRGSHTSHRASSDLDTARRRHTSAQHHLPAHVRLLEDADDASSAFSCDAEGYYTSFHCDSGLKPVENEDVDGRTTLEDFTESLIGSQRSLTRQSRKKTPPPPPARSSATLLSCYSRNYARTAAELNSSNRVNIGHLARDSSDSFIDNDRPSTIERTDKSKTKALPETSVVLETNTEKQGIRQSLKRCPTALGGNQSTPQCTPVMTTAARAGSSLDCRLLTNQQYTPTSIRASRSGQQPFHLKSASALSVADSQQYYHLVSKVSESGAADEQWIRSTAQANTTPERERIVNSRLNFPPPPVSIKINFSPSSSTEEWPCLEESKSPLLHNTPNMVSHNNNTFQRLDNYLRASSPRRSIALDDSAVGANASPIGELTPSSMRRTEVDARSDGCESRLSASRPLINMLKQLEIDAKLPWSSFKRRSSLRLPMRSSKTPSPSPLLQQNGHLCTDEQKLRSLKSKKFWSLRLGKKSDLRNSDDESDDDGGFGQYRTFSERSRSYSSDSFSGLSATSTPLATRSFNASCELRQFTPIRWNDSVPGCDNISGNGYLPSAASTRYDCASVLAGESCETTDTGEQALCLETPSDVSDNSTDHVPVIYGLDDCASVIGVQRAGPPNRPTLSSTVSVDHSTNASIDQSMTTLTIRQSTPVTAEYRRLPLQPAARSHSEGVCFAHHASCNQSPKRTAKECAAIASTPLSQFKAMVASKKISPVSAISAVDRLLLAKNQPRPSPDTTGDFRAVSATSRSRPGRRLSLQRTNVINTTIPESDEELAPLP